jgi:uncharacterized membrane protein YtjA (UPF0391 family)
MVCFYRNFNLKLQSPLDRHRDCRGLGLGMTYDKITEHSDGGSMIYWALMFLLVAVIAAVFGFTGIALAAAGIAKLLFFIFLVLFVITFATHLTRTGTRV